MEFIIEQMPQPKPIVFNYEEMKAELVKKLNDYKGLVYTETQIREAKADVAQLRKVKKQLSDERIRIEKEYSAPVKAFADQVKELCSLIDEPINEVDAQVKAYEQKKKDEKREAILDYMESLEWDGMDLTNPSIFDEKWLNASVSMASVKSDIDGIREHLFGEMDYLKDTVPAEYLDEAKDYYRKTFNFAATLSHVNVLKAKVEAIKAKSVEPTIQPIAMMPAETPTVAQEAPEITQTICFRVTLTKSQAKALGEFCRANNIVLGRLE